jgi:hypothetical protein
VSLWPIFMRSLFKIASGIFLILYVTFGTKGQVLDTAGLWKFNSLTYSQKLDFCSIQESIGFKVTFSNIDSINKTADIKINFHFSTKAIKILEQVFLKQNSLADTFSSHRPRIKHENNTTFVLKNIKFDWNEKTQSFISIDTMRLYEINGTKLDKIVIGYFEARPSHEINFIISPSASIDNSYYFFCYKVNLLQTISSNQDFNVVIKNTRVSKRELKSKKGLGPYQYTLSTEMKKKAFLMRIK